MSASVAPTVPHPWPRQQQPAPFGARELGRSSDGVTYWLLKPNCSITPRQLGAVYLSLCAVSTLIAAFFYAQGAPFVAAFAGLELLGLGAALLVFARHAGDFESITLQGHTLRLRRQRGGRIDEHEWPLAWLTIEPALAQGSLVQLRGRGVQLHVGRHLPAHARARLATELRLAQRRALATAHE